VNHLIAQGVLAMLVAALVGSFGYAFGSSGAATKAMQRISARRWPFRIGGFLIVAGIVCAAEADAILVLAGLDNADPRYALPTTLGFALLLSGVAVLDGVLWWPGRGKAAA